jgi:hypothetical protein
LNDDVARKSHATALQAEAAAAALAAGIDASTMRDRDEAAARVFIAGTIVTLCGLHNNPHLNGQVGVRCVASSRRRPRRSEGLRTE